MEKSNDLKESNTEQRSKKGANKKQHKQQENCDETKKGQATTKAYKNPALLNEKSTEKEDSIQNLIENCRISTDTNKIIAKDLTKHKETKWQDLGISEANVNTLLAHGFLFPSPVQYQSIKEIIKGKDVLVRAKNGSGKTLSYLIPIIERIDTSKLELQAVVVVPIRELALQIARVARKLYKDLNIKSIPLVGGSNLENDLMRISAGVHLLIGTPGRLLDVLERDLCTMGSNPTVVFDEADKLLDSIFFTDMFKLLEILPAKRQLCLYSATFPTSTKSFVDTRMNTPVCIRVSEEYTLFNIALFYALVTTGTKLLCLKSLITALDINQCVIYCNNIKNVQNLAQKITEMGYSCYFIHSKMSQDERNIIFHSFLNNKCKILVSSDITTRGTDVKGVNVVINFDVPVSSESFLHRQGRAGRFGTQGTCITLASEGLLHTVEMYASFVGSPLLPCSDESFKSYCKK